MNHSPIALALYPGALLKKVGLLLLLTLSACILVGCGSSRSITAPTNYGLSALTDQEIARMVAESNPRIDYLRSSIKASIATRGKEVSTRVDFSMLNGRAMRLVLIPFPLVEAGRIWLDTDRVVGINNLGDKMCMTASWAVLSDALDLPLSYPTLQELLLGIVRGASHIGSQARASHPAEAIGRKGDDLFVSSKKDGLSYVWTINGNGRPQSLFIDKHTGGDYARWDYGDYQNVPEHGAVPCDQTIRIYEQGRLKATLRLKLGKLRVEPFDTAILSPKDNKPVVIRSAQELTRIFSSR